MKSEFPETTEEGGEFEVEDSGGVGRLIKAYKSTSDISIMIENWKLCNLVVFYGPTFLALSLCYAILANCLVFLLSSVNLLPSTLCTTACKSTK